MNIEDKILELVKDANPANPMSYVQNIVKGLALDKMNQAIENCNECNICKCKKTIGYGNPNASILILGESALKVHQNLQDSPPVAFGYGEEYSVIEIIESLNVDLNSIYTLNSVQCFPVDSCNNLRLPTVNERKRCKTFVEYAIDTIKPLLIISVGGVALNTANETNEKKTLMNCRGEIFYYRGIPVMPTYAPKVICMFEGSTDLDGIKNQHVEYIREDIEKAIEFFKNNYETNIFK